MKNIIFFFFVMGSLYANTVYKYVDRDGNVVYTNTPIAGVSQAKLPALSSYSSHNGTSVIPKIKSTQVAYTTKTTKGNASLNQVSSKISDTTSGSFPSIDTQTQKNRDLSRKGILVQELSTEEKALADTRKLLDNDTKNTIPAEQLQRYKNAILDHEKNIDAIRKEISRL